MKNKIVSILLSISSLVLGSMIHKSLEYIDKPASMAAVRKSLGTSPEKAEERIIARTGGISNLDLPRIANEYWRHFTKGEGEFIDLINDETRQNGYKPLGLVADDIEYIETFIRKSFLGRSLQGERVPVESFELALPELPKFLENEYEYTTYDIIESVLDSDDYSHLGPKEIRVDVAYYFFQKHNKEKSSGKRPELPKFLDDSSSDSFSQEYKKKENSSGKRYLFSLKNSSNNYQAQFNREIRTVLNSLESQVEYIDNLKDSIDPRVEYLIVRSDDLVNQKDKLDAILKPDQVKQKLKVTVVFDQQDTVIRDSFKVPDSIKNLVVVGKNIIQIGERFLFNCRELQSIDLINLLLNIREVKSDFLYGCSGLKSIDLSLFLNVRKIEGNFLHGCSGLKSIDLSPLSNVRKTDGYFLNGCSGLKSIDLSPLSKVEEIECFFLSGCIGLQNLDLSPLSNVKKVKFAFLSGCIGLQNIDLSPLSNVKEIGFSFLSGCRGLQNIDLSFLLNISEIHFSFLNNCTGLKNIKMTQKIRSLLPEDFFKQFKDLTEENIEIVNEESVNVSGCCMQ